MKNKLIILLLVITFICSIISLVGNIREKNELKNELNEVHSEVTSLQAEATSLQDELNKATKDLRSNEKKSKELESALQEANQTIEDLKGSEYKLVYLGNFKYTYYCDERRDHICGGSGMTASGKPTQVGTTIAVDKSVIPLGTTVYIEGVGFRVAQDTGSAVKGKHIDILVERHKDAMSQGLSGGGVWILVKNS